MFDYIIVRGYNGNNNQSLATCSISDIYAQLFFYPRKGRWIAMNKDRRIARTRKLLHESFMKLMLEKGYEAITIQHIIDHANIGRSTFYSHFLDKEDLLQSGFDQLKLQLAQHQLHNASTPGISALQPVHLSFTLAMFQHAQEHYDLYRALVGRQSGALVQQFMKEMLYELIKQEFAANRYFDDLEPLMRELVVQYVVSSFHSTMTWWLDQKMPFTAEQIDEKFHALTMPGIIAVLVPSQKK